MSVAASFSSASPTHCGVSNSLDLFMTSPLSCGRSVSSNSWLDLSPSPAPVSPGNGAAYADLPPQLCKIQSHSHLSKTVSSPCSLSSLGSDVFTAGKDSKVIVCGPTDDEAVNRRSVARKRPAKLAIPESAKLASFRKAKLFVPPEQQDFYRQEDELFAVAARRGRKDYMEDSYSVSTSLQEGSCKQAFFGVFDGHGGNQAAQFVAANLCQQVSAALRSQKIGMTDLEDAMHNAYISTDLEFLNQHTSSGACAVSVLIKEGEMVVSNAGDCKAVLCRSGQAECLSTLHCLSNKVERQRVEDLGGFVDCYSGTWRLQGSLAVARGFGDARLKRWVSAEPAVKRCSITSDTEFLILASDGLWDQLSEQEAVDTAKKVLGLEMVSRSDFLAPIPTTTQFSVSACVINKQDKPHATCNLIDACEELIHVACHRGNRDDITVMIVALESFAIANH